MKEELILNESKLICIFGEKVDFFVCNGVKEKIFENLSIAKEVIFDLSKTNYVSPAFLRITLATLKKVGKNNFSLINVNSSHVKKVLKISNLTALNIHECSCKKSKIYA